MSLEIYLDDCACAKALISLLRAAGHEVVTPDDAGIARQSDDVHFRYAQSHDLVILTFNVDDFAELHGADSRHAGIFGVHQDNDVTRDMSYADIMRAIANIEAAGVDVRGTLQPLNAWRY